eukprot:CAMPEP_0174258610 /NCGR_PEP_ID=MMETSP0439-20130205/7577_1 /TAXON_ID=0 /ORGANISM="Stereomyxa ramosa, Strain Chinc5" /LENGTH=88 /DNA_ID=CAMNT_0015342183 /DNA_START=135 /DNA_END=401 /DNA_ORIENTATION=-
MSNNTCTSSRLSNSCSTNYSNKNDNNKKTNNGQENRNKKYVTNNSRNYNKNINKSISKAKSIQGTSNTPKEKMVKWEFSIQLQLKTER